MAQSKKKMMQNAREAERASDNRRHPAVQIAAQACRPYVNVDIPREITELAYIIEHSSRMPSTYPGHRTAKAIIARGMPIGEFTRRDGSSSAPVMRG